MSSIIAERPLPLLAHLGSDSEPEHAGHVAPRGEPEADVAPSI
jgi:hypothetical protein